ncbi:ATP-binding protein [Methanocella sp. MCL-LM]|uniref:ATP-binding protein n=1 Tax=Methanocella sp. MCL-LM TaxID=3412035 RepID=UPI003C771F65
MLDTGRHYLLGNTGDSGSSLYLGRYLALDGSQGAPVLLDVRKPHAVVICGKRGYGKSYTMGVLVEEFAGLPEAIRKNFSVIVVDTMGIFGCMSGTGSIDVRVFAPVPFLRDMPAGTLPFEIPTGSLSVYDYCELLGIGPLSPHGAALAGAISESETFSIESLIDNIGSSGASPEVRSAVCGLLSMASSWKLFSQHATFASLLEPGSINVIDLSGYGHDPGIKSCAVASLARALYDIRVRARRRENGSREVPLIWMMIDEAHMFLEPGSGAGRVLVNEWLRQGRQPGLSLVLATQRPSALGYDVLSQSDVIVCHRLTLRDDVEALERARPLYVKEPVREALARLGNTRGAAIVVDDATESYHVIKVRQRKSLHGGGEPDIYGAD